MLGLGENSQHLDFRSLGFVRLSDRSDPTGARQKLHDWQLAGAFYLPWVCVTFLQIANFSCGDEAH